MDLVAAAEGVLSDVVYTERTLSRPLREREVPRGVVTRLHHVLGGSFRRESNLHEVTEHVVAFVAGNAVCFLGTFGP
jgi:hypothetical protein